MGATTAFPHFIFLEAFTIPLFLGEIRVYLPYIFRING